jgi:hypothetical protein
MSVCDFCAAPAPQPPPAASPVRAEIQSNVPRLALEILEACTALGVGWDFWREHVAPEVRIVRRGRKKLVPVAELERWLEANAELVLPATGQGHPCADESPENRGARARRAPAWEAA